MNILAQNKFHPLPLVYKAAMKTEVSILTTLQFYELFCTKIGLCYYNYYKFPCIL